MNKRESLLEAAKPLIKWINENCHPHHVCHVDHTNVELFEGQIVNKTDEFLKD
jgi:hypothetical protein